MSARSALPAGHEPASVTTLTTGNHKLTNVPENPSSWRPELAYRGGNYRYFDHQNGVAGHLLIRLFAGKNLDGRGGFFSTGSNVNPYVVFEVNGKQARSTVVRSNRNPTWRREELELAIPKTDLLFDRVPVDPHIPGSGMKAILRIQVWSSTSVTKKVTGYVGLGGDELLGEAALDITELVEGDLELFDEFVPLTKLKPKILTAKDCAEAAPYLRRSSGKKLSDGASPPKTATPPIAPNGGSDDHSRHTGKGVHSNEHNSAHASGAGASGANGANGAPLYQGAVRVMLQYEPNGLEPRVGDVLNLEGYGAFPHNVLPPAPSLPLITEAVSGNYVLCSFSTLHAKWTSKVRFHRFRVFVVERQTCVDRVYDSVMVPMDYLGRTRPGKVVVDVVGPYVTVMRILSAPMVATAKTMLGAATRSSEAALKAALNY